MDMHHQIVVKLAEAEIQRPPGGTGALRRDPATGDRLDPRENRAVILVLGALTWIAARAISPPPWASSGNSTTSSRC